MDDNIQIENPFSFEDVFKSTPCYLTVQGPDLRILAVNDTFKEQFGESIGLFCYEAYKNCESRCSDCPVQKTFSDGQNHISEQIVTLPEKGEVPIVAFTSPVRGPSGEILAVVELSADISLVKRLEIQLRESRERFRLLFDEAPCFISVQDKNLCIVESNRKFKEAFGDYEGAYCYEIYKHRKQQCLNCPVLATFHDGKSHYSEEVVTSLTGEQINTLAYTAPICDSDGNIEMVMEMSTDITQIRKLQGQLTNLGMFVGSISHGLKGLIMSLDGGMYMLKTGLKNKIEDRIETGWQMVQRNVSNIRRVVLDLLYIAGDREQQFEIISLKELAESVELKLRKRAENLHIDFQVEVDCAEDKCEIDFRSLKGSMVNILENAIEACRIDSSKEGHFVRFSLTSDKDNAIFHIEDNGIGMSRETREKMFSMSFTATGKEGRVLGLFAANKVIEKHRGVIEVDSEPKKGTTFHIRIPKVRSDG